MPLVVVAPGAEVITQVEPGQQQGEEERDILPEDLLQPALPQPTQEPRRRDQPQQPVADLPDGR